MSSVPQLGIFDTDEPPAQERPGASAYPVHGVVEYPHDDEPANLEAHGFTAYVEGESRRAGPTDEEKQTAAAALELMARGGLRRWHISYTRPDGVGSGYAADWPADLDELAVMHEAMQRDGRGIPTVRLEDLPTGSHGWLRVGWVLIWIYARPL